MKSLLDVRGRLITQNCKIVDWQDKRLDKWKEISTVDTIEEISNESNVKATKRFYYIYCFKYNNTIGGIYHVCPMTTLRIPNWRNIIVGDFELKAEYREINITEDENIKENIYYGQFTEDKHIRNELEILKSFEETKKELNKITLESFVVKKKETLLSTSSIILVMLVLYLSYNYRNKL